MAGRTFRPPHGMSPELRAALEAFEQGALDRVVLGKRPEDFSSLRSLVIGGTSIDPSYRQRAVQALGRWGDSSVVGDIVQFLLSPEAKESHRITAIEALGRLGTRPAREAVELFVNHRSAQVRKFVVHALKRIGDSPALSLLRKIAKEDEVEWIRALATRALKRPTPRRHKP